MDPNGILTTAAEIAITIAGFSGITVAVGPLRTGVWPESARLGLSVLLVMTASTLTFAFVPLVIASAGVSERMSWVSASLLHGSWLIAIMWYRNRQSRHIAGVGHLARIRLVVPSIVAGVTAFQLANAFWIQEAWPFFASIIVMNVLAFVVFSILLSALVLSEGEPE